MDKYVIRGTRVGANYPQGNQMMAFSTNVGSTNILPPETVYYDSPYANPYTNMQQISNSSYVDAGKLNPASFARNMHPAQTQMMTGIDPRYLANYSDNSAQYIISGQPPQSETSHLSNDPSFGSNYQNRSFTGVEKNKPKTFTPVISRVPRPVATHNVIYEGSRPNAVFQPRQHIEDREKMQSSPIIKGLGTAKVAETKVPKKEHQNLIMSRTEKLQALHKSGPRAFSGPVEKVLKWHKALQDIGVFVFYEIVAKCVSVRPGDSCSKNLVIRDENGPAMQVVYYEIDFLLPELKVPSTVRVIGRMMAGTCRLQAFSVRPATGDDVAILPRRAAVAAHHVSKLCKEYMG